MKLELHIPELDQLITDGSFVMAEGKVVPGVLLSIKKRAGHEIFKVGSHYLALGHILVTSHEVSGVSLG
eukprot:6476014-Amphidinium_carterae.1